MPKRIAEKDRPRAFDEGPMDLRQTVLKVPLRRVERPAPLPIRLVIADDHPLVRELLAYARIGHKKGVSGKLDQIEGAALLEATTLNVFRDLVTRMQFEKLALTIESRVL